MNRSSVFSRRIGYLVVLIAMLIPLFLLGQPGGGEGDSGGRLASMRVDYNIAESDLGEINPASETAKLATLGLRGIAATLLWQKSHEYGVRHEWDRLKASLNQIALLQPHFDKVWEHQAWNLAYNVSSQFDDYRQRYEMVREGTEFLQRGVRQNRRAPRLVWYTGWFYGQKIGKSDEKVQFRRLFADDTLQHDELRSEGIRVEEAHGPLNKPDNWLVGRLWMERGYDLVDKEGIAIRRQTPLNFYESGPKWMFEHATVIEKEGILDDRAQIAWQKAHRQWVGDDEAGVVGLGNRPIPTTAFFKVRLGDLVDLLEELQEKKDQIVKLAGEKFLKAKQAKIDQLDADLKSVWDTPIELRSEDDRKVIEFIETQVQPDADTLVAECPPENQLEAKRLLGEIRELDDRIRKTNGYRNQINYEYWETLALAEKESRTVKAREKIYLAEKANTDAELDRAIELYESAFDDWAQIFDDYPILVIDDSAEDLFRSVQRYFTLVETQQMPDDFPLKTFVEMMGSEGRVSAEAYAVVREEQAALTAQRQRELDERERELRRQAEEKKERKEKPAEEKPAEEKSAEEKPAEEKPAEEKPAEEKSADEKSAEEKPAEEKSAEEKPAEEKPAEEKPAEEKPAEEKPAEEKPAEEKPAEEKSAEEKPAEEKPAEEKPAEEKPAEEKSADEKPAGEKEE